MHTKIEQDLLFLKIFAYNSLYNILYKTTHENK